MQAMAKMEDAIFAKLKLSPAQLKKIKDLRAARDAKMKKAFAAAPKGGDPREMFKSMRPISQEYRAQVDAVMTPAQKTQFDALRKAEMEKMRAKWGRGPGGPGGPGSR